jgi:CRP/FNR family cyclic AMP-dependent transcriptional regulator
MRAGPPTLSPVSDEHRETVAVLDADAELGRGLDRAAAAKARRRLIAPVWHVEPGPWTAAPRRSAQVRHLGFLVIEGLLAREVVLPGGTSLELLGSGDVIGAADDDEAAAPGAEVSWSALQPTTLAELDEQFAVESCHWPPVVAALLRRAFGRSARLAVQRTISQQTGVPVRLMLVFWHLAERWGHVSPEGIVLGLDLPHESLARLIGATRTSITTALGELRADGLVTRTSSDSWVLSPDIPQHLLDRVPPHVVVPSQRIQLGW